VNNNISNSLEPVYPKKKLRADGFEYMFQSTKEFIDKQPLHAPYKITALEYHGYKETPENIKHVLEELKYELSVYPQYSDILLDKINEMNVLLKKYE
jgi:hypothetical protein